MYITKTKQHNKDDNNGDEECMCTFVHLYITKGSRERFPLHNITTKVRQFIRKVGTTILSSTKFGKLVGRMLLRYPNWTIFRYLNTTWISQPLQGVNQITKGIKELDSPC